MDIYEVELCHRGRWEQQDARFVAARNADEAAYKVTGIQLRSEGERRKISATRPQAWQWKPTAHTVLCRVIVKSLSCGSGRLLVLRTAAASAVRSRDPRCRRRRSISRPWSRSL